MSSMPCRTLYTVFTNADKWRTRGKKLVPSHESEVLEKLEDKQKLVREHV